MTPATVYSAMNRPACLLLQPLLYLMKIRNKTEDISGIKKTV